MLNSISKKQRIILLLVAGISSLVGLEGLSNPYRDYYVTAAISQAILTAILLFVILSPLYFIDFRKLVDSLNDFLNKRLHGTLLDKFVLLVLILISAFIITKTLLFFMGDP